MVAAWMAAYGKVSANIAMSTAIFLSLVFTGNCSTVIVYKIGFDHKLWFRVGATICTPTID